MIVDHHTHTFPPEIASRALNKLSAGSQMHYHNGGTIADLIEVMSKSKVSRSILMPVATKPGQAQGINDALPKQMEEYEQHGIYSFGAIYPLDEDYKNMLFFLKEHGILGIKLHPVFQNVPLDDIHYEKIISYASELDMWTMIHPGYDIGFPGNDLASVPRVIRMLSDVKPQKLILAHMGGWNQWNEVESDLAGSSVYLDTSFSITKVHQLDGNLHQYLSNEQFIRIARKHGLDRIFFGSDNPWSNQKDAVEEIENCGLSTGEAEQLLSNNIWNV
ncbi:MAG: amidohydrolase family protein [Lachnospiraceae bacterium]|nr:amidohydrolase family protein [Candidatus Merdinaster equi]